MSVLFIQRRTHRAGAQTCLLRLLREPRIRALDPVVLASEEGWLTRECAREGVKCVVEPFPSSRSLSARLFRNRAFARRAAPRIAQVAPKVTLVHGNDHLESLLTLEVGDALGAKTALFLRSPTMSGEDFEKYRCADHPLLAAVGEALQARARSAGARKVELIHDGLEPGEFLAPKPPSPAFPKRILVIGSPVEWKGWDDALAVFSLLEKELPLEIAFTGKGEKRLEQSKVEYLGRVEAFRDLVRGYDLVFNPSWHESFGMAALEVLAAGVPLFSTRSGVIEQVVHDERWLAKPRDVPEMAARLKALAADWPSSALDVAACQARIRGRFMVEHSAAKLQAAYAALALGKHRAEGVANPRI
jgi:glycosyltransferase involved in cell wall biosynthesis